jgi:UDP-GlcNAc3NAcA epimerase
MLEKNARLIATDSGGIQKEAYFHEVPCITLRDKTEWVELVENGYNCLVGSDPRSIIKSLLIEPPAKWGKKLYGDGTAAQKVIDKMLAKACK